MFDELEFDRIKKLPDYVFATISDIKLALRREGNDVIDFSMGNPDGDTPKFITDKLIEVSSRTKVYGYSSSKGVYKLRVAISDWYKRKYGVDIDPDSEAVATMGSKEGYVHLIQAITNSGDVAIVPNPTYPIHAYAITLAGGTVRNIELPFNKFYEIEEDRFLADIERTVKESIPRVKYIVVNFPHNPSTATVTLDFYKKLVEMAKRERFYIISDIAYADITFDGYRTPSIFEVEGAKEIAVESFTLSKSYNMAGWRVGFVVGNSRLVTALQKMKSWLDYGMFTPIQVAATVALNEGDEDVRKIVEKYRHRRDILIESFDNAGWSIVKPQASMFVWAKLPKKAQHLGSLEFSKRLLTEADVAVSPGIGFGSFGEDYVRIALIENEKRIRQAAKNIKKFLKKLK
jgi:alanine-synthesizing transaminase